MWGIYPPPLGDTVKNLFVLECDAEKIQIYPDKF